MHVRNCVTLCLTYIVILYLLGNMNSIIKFVVCHLNVYSSSIAKLNYVLIIGLQCLS